MKKKENLWLPASESLRLFITETQPDHPKKHLCLKVSVEGKTSKQTNNICASALGLAREWQGKL